MRPILAALLLVLLPNLASAECTCTCLRGRSTAVCQPPSLVQPICQQVCVEKIEQSLGTIGGGGGGGGGTAGGFDALSAAGSGIGQSTVNSLLGR